MNTLKATHPHFVRCIIPNEIKTGGKKSVFYNYSHNKFSANKLRDLNSRTTLQLEKKNNKLVD